MGEWISVEERRPKEVVEPDGGINCVLAYAPGADVLPEMQTCTVRFFNVGGRDYYTHWMELPEAPKA